MFAGMFKDRATGPADSLEDRRQTWAGFGNALSRAVELVATPVLFGLGGWFLDRGLGTRPAFTLALFLLAIVGMATRSYYAYAAEMDAHDRAGAWSRDRDKERDKEDGEQAT
jgi:F0F1-type ATP synthase assembly protein I